MKWYLFLRREVEFAKFGHVPFTHHQQHLNLHPPGTRQAISQHNTSHPNPPLNTTSNTPHNILRDTSLPHPQSSATSNAPHPHTQPNTTSNTARNPI